MDLDEHKTPATDETEATVTLQGQIITTYDALPVVKVDTDTNPDQTDEERAGIGGWDARVPLGEVIAQHARDGAILAATVQRHASFGWVECYFIRTVHTVHPVDAAAPVGDVHPGAVEEADPGT